MQIDGSDSYHGDHDCMLCCISIQSIDTILNIPLPHKLCVAIHDKYEYQRDLYFTSFVEQTITCTYPNEYIVDN